MPLYLADTSIWGWADSGRRPDIQLKLAARIQAGEVATCVPVVLEALHRARTGEEYHRLRSKLFDPLAWAPVTAEAAGRALDVQAALADTKHGAHLRPAIDYLVAATAELAGPQYVLWFFDRDLEVICGHTGQPFEAEAASGAGG